MLSFNYPALTIGTMPYEQGVDTVRVGALKILDTFEVVFENFRIIEDGMGVDRTNKQILRDDYSFNLRVDDDVDDTYYGGANADDEWAIKNVPFGDEETTYANMENNPTFTTLDDAWNSRTTLTYDVLNDLVL